MSSKRVSFADLTDDFDSWEDQADSMQPSQTKPTVDDWEKEASTNWADEEDDARSELLDRALRGEVKISFGNQEEEEEFSRDEEDVADDLIDEFGDIELTEEEIEASETLPLHTRQKNEAGFLSVYPFRQEATDTICNLDLSPLRRNDVPNPNFMRAVAATFPDTVIDDLAMPLQQKFFEPLTDSNPKQIRYVIEVETGSGKKREKTAFVLRREDYIDFSDDVIHQYFVMAHMRAVWEYVPMLAYPFGIFSASRNCTYTGDIEKDSGRLHNFLLYAYTPFNRDDKIGGVPQSGNDPLKRQMSFHVAMAPPRTQQRGVFIKPLITPYEAWNLILLMDSFLRFANEFYGFSHGDAHYYNWHLRDFGEMRKITIPLRDGDEDYYTSYLPVLSEFGRSSIYIEGKRYAQVSNYYAVPPAYDFIRCHDLLQLMYGFVKDLDQIRHKYPQGARNHWMKHYFDGTLAEFRSKYPEFRGVNIAEGTNRSASSGSNAGGPVPTGTTFAEVARLLRDKNDVVLAIFAKLNKDFDQRRVYPSARPLKHSTEAVKRFNVKCPVMPSFPKDYTRNDKDELSDTRRRSELIIHLRENNEQEDTSEIIERLMEYMELSMHMKQYESKEGVVVDIILDRLSAGGLGPKNFSPENKEIYNRFISFKKQQDLAHRDTRQQANSAQIKLAGDIEYIQRGGPREYTSPPGSRGGSRESSPYGTSRQSPRSYGSSSRYESDAEGFSSASRRRR